MLSSTATAPTGLAPTVDLLATPGGVVELAASADHRVKIHAGDPVTGACGRDRFTYRRGDVDILPAGASDAWEEDQPSTALLVHVPTALLRRAADELGLPAARAGVEPRHQIRDPQIEHIGWALDAERRAGVPGGRLVAESLGLALAFHLLGRYPAPRREVVGLSGPRRRRVEAYIEAHLDRSLSLPALAEVAGLGTTQFKLQFKRSTGLAVHEYVMRRRVERARALLLADRLPAGQVALAAGFAHQSHMARWMRRVLGVTPRALRG